MLMPVYEAFTRDREEIIELQDACLINKQVQLFLCKSKKFFGGLLFRLLHGRIDIRSAHS
jgi:hypothetical protein